MELARLYPRWLTGGVFTPQPEYYTGHPLELLTVLRGSILHRAYLSDLFGTDYPGTSPRVRLTYLVWSYARGVRYLVHHAPTGAAVSVTTLWPSANWFEREAWEMFGVRFIGHPDLRRLLTDYGFIGRPLLKDFPVTGYVEVRYSERAKRVVSKPISFTQEFRTFEFTSPWQN